MEAEKEKNSLKTLIETLNTLSLKTYPDKKENKDIDKEIDKDKNISQRYVNDIKEIFEKENKNEKINNNLLELLCMNDESLSKHGDELLENLWKLYANTIFNIPSLTTISTPEQFFIDLFFLNNAKLNTLKEQNIIKIKENLIEINISKEFVENNILSKDSSKEALLNNRNVLIDLIIFNMFCKTASKDLKGFYTSLSGFVVTTESSVFLLYKTISLFALCLFTMEKKENFVDSLFYILSGVLRDHARSYLKTKGVLNENLSYHKCSKHVKKLY
jgi:hypothetical protein